VHPAAAPSTCAELLGEVVAIHEAALSRPPKARADAGRSYATAGGAAGPAVAIVAVDGPLAQRGVSSWLWGVTGYDEIAATVTAALGSQDVDAVVLRLDSPGGDVAGLFECVRRIQEAKAASGKPVLAFVDEQACSAAYLLATTADQIFLPATGEVGSIGCLAVHAERSRMLQDAGVGVTVARYPDRKAELNSLEPLSSAASKELQSQVQGFAEMFIAAVAKARGISAKKILGLEGITFVGTDAVEQGLADGIASLEQVVDMAANAAEEKEANMKVTSTVAALLGVSADASPEQIEAAAREASAYVSLGRHAMALSGAATPEGARGVLEAHAREARDTAALRSQLSELSGRLGSEDRIRALEEGVRAGKLTPGEAWAGGDKAAGPAPFFADRSAEQIRAYVSTCSPRLASTPSTSSAPKPKKKSADLEATIAGLTPEDRQMAASLGISQKKFAKMKLKRLAQPGAFGHVGGAPGPDDDDADDDNEEKEAG
jgi:signal peptide peptidase SppA